MTDILRLTHGRNEPGAPDAVGALVLRALEGATGADGEFLARRAERAVETLPRGPERRHLAHLLRTGLASDPDPDERTGAMVAWAGHLESRGHLEWADEVYARAQRERPGDPELVLHRARVARKDGRDAAAGALYDQVVELDDGSGRLARMALVGHALLAPDPGPALGRAMRRCLDAGDREAAAAAQEARARVRRAAGDVDGALRDFAGAALRFGEPADLGRVGHEVADLLVAASDPTAARLVLLEVERRGHPRQAAQAAARLLTLSRALGDQLGLRRWADAATPELVSLTPRRRGPRPPSRTPRVGRALARLAALPAR